MTGNLTRCPLCLEPVALCSCDEIEREVAMAARATNTAAVPVTVRLTNVSGGVNLDAVLFACRDPEQAWVKDQQDAADG